MHTCLFELTIDCPKVDPFLIPFSRYTNGEPTTLAIVDRAVATSLCMPMINAFKTQSRPLP